MSIVRKGLATATAVVALSGIGLVTPAHAVDRTTTPVTTTTITNVSAAVSPGYLPIPLPRCHIIRVGGIYLPYCPIWI